MEVQKTAQTGTEEKKTDTMIEMAEMSKKVQNVLEQERKKRNSFCRAYKGNIFLLDAKEDKEMALGEIKLPVVGDVSAGKSCLNNALCKFPISPVAKTVTSACPLEIRYVPRMEDEMLEVAEINSDDVYTSLTVLYTYKSRDGRIDKNLFRALYNYSVELGTQKVIQLGDTLEYFKAPEKDFLGTGYDSEKDVIPGTILDPEDPRHVMFLLMLLLATYVEQDKPKEYLTEEQKKILESRKGLMGKLGISEDTAYVIRLYWHSENIPEKTVIIDLPGLGAAAQDGNGQMAHDKQVDSYLKNTPSLMFLLGSEGVIKNEKAKAKIDAFIETNKAKASPARLLFVINKADLIIEGCNTPDSQDDAVKTIIGKYTQNPYERYKDFPFYAISARCGEKYFLESCIPLDNMFRTRSDRPFLQKLCKSAAMRSNMANESLKDSFEQKYACRIDANTYTHLDLKTFIGEYFSGQVAKIRLLQSFEDMETHFAKIGQWADAIITEFTHLDSADAFTSDVISLIGNASKDALNRTLDHTVKAFSEISDDIYKCVRMDNIDISGKLTLVEKAEIEATHPGWMMEIEAAEQRVRTQGSVMDIFKKCDDALSRSINGKISRLMDKFEKKQNGKVPLDKNAFISDRAKKNYTKLIDCGKEISRMDHLSFFDDAFDRLKKVFKRDMEAYNSLVNRVIKHIENMPAEMIADMKSRFNDIWRKARSKDVPESLYGDFRRIFDENAERMTELLGSLFRELITKLKNDKRFERAIDKTVDDIREALDIILMPYRSDFGGKIYGDIVKGSWLVYVDPPKFKEFINKNYIKNFSDKLNNKIISILFGGSGVSTSDSHVVRMNESVSGIQHNYISYEKQNEIKNKLLGFIDGLGSVIKSPDRVSNERKKLLEAGKRLESFFGQGSAYEMLSTSLVPAMKNVDWATAALEHAEKLAEKTRKTVISVNSKKYAGSSGRNG